MSKIRIFSLGGLNELGKNMYVIDVDNDLFIFDAGLKYPDDKLLGIDYIFGSVPKMDGDVIQGISEEDFPGSEFKYEACLKIINQFHAKKENIYGIGDSFVDIKMLSLAGHRFAINPKGGIENEVDHVVNDLKEVIPYIE